MDTYLLKSEETGIEAFLTSIPTTSELFSEITPHESTDPKLVATLAKDLKDFRFEQALYCATTEPFLNKKDLDSEHIKSLSSKEFGEQSIHLLKEEISLDSFEKIILLDGHHRFEAINKHHIKSENEVPILFINFDDVEINDHYFISKSMDYGSPVFNRILQIIGGNALAGMWSRYHGGTGDSEDYDIVYHDTAFKSFYYYKDLDEDRRKKESRFDLRDKIFEISPDFKPVGPSAPIGINLLVMRFAVKAPTKEELLSGEVFPTKSTWITPKFNPDLYKEYLN